MEELQKIENLEKKYFDSIGDCISNNQDYILERLSRGDLIRRQWIGRGVGKKTNLYDKAAEKVIRWVIINYYKWDYLPIPISSDECYEVEDAIIHLDVKTFIPTDLYDVENYAALNQDYPVIKYKHLVLSLNQSSYPHPPVCGFSWEPKLPTIYEFPGNIKKPCLTYFIRIVYTIVCPRCNKIQDIGVRNKNLKDILKIKTSKYICTPFADKRYCINSTCKKEYEYPGYRFEEAILYCMPNGELKDYYGKDLILNSTLCYKSGISKNKKIVAIKDGRFRIEKIETPEKIPPWWNAPNEWTRVKKVIDKKKLLFSGIL